MLLFRLSFWLCVALASDFPLSLYDLSILENAGPKTYCQSDKKILLKLEPNDDVSFKLFEEEVHGGSEIFKVEKKRIGFYFCALIRTKGGTTSTSSLNRERTHSYSFILQATIRSQGHETVKTTKVSVNVLDVDDHPPYFLNPSFNVEVFESTLIGSTIFTVSATDSDVGRNGQLLYTILNDVPNFVIEPTTGKINLVSQLSFEKQPNLTISVKIDDRGQKNYPGGSHTVSVHEIFINVKQNNTEAPSITLTHLPAVIEQGLQGSLYAILKISDRDTGKNGEIKNVQILSGDPDGHFELLRSISDKSLWNLKIAHSLDREDMPDGYNLSIRAVDGGQPGRATFYHLLVDVIDTNDNKPHFLGKFSHSASEYVAPHSPLFKVLARDRDLGKNALVKYKIIGGNDDKIVSINEENGWIFRTASLSFKLRPSYLLTVQAIDQANFGTQLSETVTFTLSFKDENDNYPVLIKKQFNFDEESEIRAVLGRISSEDLDRTLDNALVTYAMMGKYHEFDIPFFIFPNGSIVATRRIDYETMPSNYDLFIRLQDRGIPFSRATDSKISIRIINVNDNKPVMMKKACNVLFYYKNEAATLVNLEAFDPDGDEIRYRIIDDNSENLFEINSITGEFGLSAAWNTYSLKQETVYEVSIVASDAKFDSDATKIKIDFSSSMRSEVNCENSESVLLMEKLKEKKQNETSKLQDYLSGGFESCCSNNNRPLIQLVGKKMTFSVSEGVPIGHTVLSFHISEFITSGGVADEGFASMVLASISEGNEDASFTLDYDNSITYLDPNPTTLVQLKVLSSLDRERKEFYYLTLTAFDLAPPYHNFSTKVSVQVLDENDNYPQFLFPGKSTKYLAQIDENSLPEEPILQVQSLDLDLNENALVQYSLPIDNNYFKIDENSGRLYLLEKLDREKKAFHVLKVEAKDSGNPCMKSYAIVNISVSDINDNAPVFYSENYRLRIPEDYPLGAFIIQIRAYDLDSESDLSYTFGFGDHHALKINSQNGVIHLTESLDYEKQKFLNLSIIVRDSPSEPLSTSTNLLIEIADVDENVYAPEFQNESQYVLVNVLENEPTGTPVSKVLALDYDYGLDGQVRYAVVGGDGFGRFSVDPLTGVIHTLDVFDRETQQFYWLDIKAYDMAAVPKYSMLFVCVEISDRNDNPPLPIMPVWHSRVHEEQPIATFVASIAATDADIVDFFGSTDFSFTPDFSEEATSFYYRVKEHSDGFQYFQVHHGLIRTSQILDRESLSKDTFELEIEISDREFESTEGLTSTARVVVHIEDTNDHSPELLDDTSEAFVMPPLSAEPDGSYVIYRVIVIDKDVGVNAQLTYSVLRANCMNLDGEKVSLDISIDQFGQVKSNMLPEVPVIIDLNINVTDKGVPPNSKFFRLIINLQQKPEDQTDFLMIARFIESEGTAMGQFVHENTLGLVEEISVFSSRNQNDDQIRPIILAGNEDKKFAIQGSRLVIAERLDCETKAEYKLVIAATDGVKFSANVTMPIRVLDVNEFSPMFGQKNYTIYVNENTHPGTSVYTLTATDMDCRYQVQFELDSFLTPHSENHFVVSVTGDIVLAKSLDHETTRRHILRIRAMDTGGFPEKSDYAYVTVLVEDASDNEPIFVTSLYDVRVFDTSAVGTVLTQVSAIDKDRGYEGLVTYQIIEGNSEYFSLNFESGDISLDKELDPEVIGKDFTLKIIAVDDTMRQSRDPAIVTIQVVSGENSPPFFEKDLYEVKIQENQPYGAYVFLAPIESFSVVRFSISTGDEEGSFDINPSTGAIFVKGVLDFERKPVYKLQIQAINSIGLVAQTTLKVTLLDVNDNHPQFERSHFVGYVSEGVPQGTVILSGTNEMQILRVTVSDRDSGINGRVRFEILDEESKKNFTIDTNTGSLRSNSVLDYETAPYIVFKVSAHDLGSPSLFALTDAVVNITILDKNDCEPKFELPAYSVTLHQPTYDGVIVAHPKAFDCDGPSMTQLRYSIVSSDADDNLFSIHPITGVITAAASRSMRRTYSLTVQVVDAPIDYLSSLVTVHITVEEALGNFLLKQSVYNATVMENRTAAQTVAHLVASDKYRRSTKLFRLRNYINMFSIGLSNGVLKTKEGHVFDREKRLTYFLQVEMRVVGVSERALALIQVTVTDVNDNAPEFVRLPYRFGVKAGSPKSTLIGKVTAIDRDHGENSIVTYDISTNFLSLFQIDRNDGSLYTRNQVPTNLIQHDLHQVLVVEASNKNNRSMRSFVNVTIEFMPQEAPLFTKSEITVRVPEDTALNAQIAQFEAVSADASRIFYTIEQGDRDQQFEINFLTGWVSVTSKLDYENGIRQYLLIIRAWDSKVSQVFSNARLNVIVEDSNDSPPLFSQPIYRASISEGSGPGTAVIKVHATDADSPQNAELQYHIITGLGSQSFQINKTSGLITTKKHLDREKIPEYTLKIQVHDNKHYDVTNVVISVNDINDCTPEFYHPEYRLQFDESFGAGTLCLGKVEAYDLDIVNQDSLFYEIKSGNEDDLFAIDRSKGLLYIRNSGEFPLEPFYQLNVTASDTVHTKMAPVFVKIQTLNRYGPSFENPDYYIPKDITEHSEIYLNQPFFKLAASDEDKGSSSEITYRIIGERASQKYRVEPKTGKLFLQSPIDREDPNLERVIRIMASDSMGRHAFTNVHVGIRDINDQIPKFEMSSYHAILYEPIPAGYYVVKVHAVDKDTGPNSEIRYSLSPNQPDDITETFQVDPISGQVFTSRRIGFPGGALSEDIMSYQFFVQASDLGNPPNTQNVPIDVYVSQSRDDIQGSKRDKRAVDSEAYDNTVGRGSKFVGPPIFTEPVENSVIELRETAPLGTVVFQVKVQSADTDPVHFSLMDTPGLNLNAPSVLEINSTGAIIKKRFFDYQDAPNKLKVVVIAKTSDAFTTSCIYYIKVLDENNNAPKFDSRMYSISIPENFYEISAERNKHVITVYASDLDSGANRQIVYELSDDASSGYFGIDENNGNVFLRKPLDRETHDKYMLTITAVDEGKHPLYARCMLNITIIDLNDNPPVFPTETTKYEINEGAPVGTVVMSLEVSDLDLPPNNFVFYYIQNSTAFENDTSDGNEDSKFNVNQTTGEIYIHGKLDREKATRYELTVVATDGKFSSTRTVIVIVADANDNDPQCSQEPNVIELVEGLRIGSKVYDYSRNVLDVDADDFSNISFSLIVADGAEVPPFSIHPVSGVLTVSNKLDRELIDRYDLWVKASDGGGKFCTMKLSIALLDINDNPPRFLGHSEAAIVGTYNVNQLITKVRAVDDDLKENKTVQYRLIGSANGKFHIQTTSGIISLARPLDQSAESYILEVEAYDQGTPELSSRTELTIRVGNSKDKPPKFEKSVYQVFISESSNVGTEVITLNALNSDENEKYPVTYSIVNGNDKKMFSMNTTNGTMLINEILDYERVRSYELEVYAIQLNEFRKPLSDKCSVLINVTDANDNAPYFPQSIIERDIPEDTQHGVSVYVAQALDRDFNSTLTYHLVSKTPNFVISPDTGVIVVGETLDYEQRSHFTLKIAAYDNGDPLLSGYMQLKINILDVNDNPPRFEKDEYNIYIPEDFPETDELAIIKVTDLDGPEHQGPFTFSVIGDYSDKFNVNSNGVLKNTRKLVVGSYKFKVNVIDSGNPPASNEVPVTVEVYKASAEPPTIFNHEVLIMILEDTFPVGKIAELTAVDNDKHDRLSYWVHKQPTGHARSPLVDTNEAQDGSLFFMQDRALLAQTNLDEGKYHVTVKVTDGIHTDNGNVSVIVQRVTHDMLMNAVTMKLAEMTPNDFLSAYLVLFQTLMTMTVFKSSNNIQVSILSIQETSNRDLDVLFCVFERLPSGKPLYVSRKVVQATLDHHVGLITPKLPIIEITSDICSETKSSCTNNTRCSTVVDLDMGSGFESYQSFSSKRNSFVVLAHQWSTMCKCNSNDLNCVEKVCRDNPCGIGRRCVAVSDATYRCECSTLMTGTGVGDSQSHHYINSVTGGISNCDYKEEQPICTSEMCKIDTNPMSFSGSGYVHYNVPSVEFYDVIDIRLSFRLDAKVDNGEMFSVFGVSDFCIIDIDKGHVRFRTNRNIAVNEAKKFNDGIWHYAQAFHDGKTSSICVDNIYCASDRNNMDRKGSKVLLSSKMVFVADRMAKRQEISQFRRGTSFDSLTWSDYYRYFGCIDDVIINNVRLPNPVDQPEVKIYPNYDESFHPTVIHHKDVEAKCNAALMTLSACANNPCFHGGQCRGAASTFECVCGDFSSGSRCESLQTTCGLSPCTSGSICRTVDNSLSNYTCHCPRGIKGEKCDSQKFCDPNPCLNGATCDDRPYSFNCQCTSGFYGDRCETDVNECLTLDTPCENGGICVNTNGSYECGCRGIASGARCEMLNEASNATFMGWVTGLPFEVLLMFFAALFIIFVCAILLITCVKYRNTKRKLRQNSHPLVPFPPYMGGHTHQSNQYMTYSKLMPMHPLPPRYSPSVFPPNNTVGSSSTLTNHSYVSSSAFRQAAFPRVPNGLGYYEAAGGQVPMNNLSMAYDSKKIHRDRKGSVNSTSLRVNLPELCGPPMIKPHMRRDSSTSENDQHYAASCYMPVMHLSDGGSSITCSLAGRRQAVARVEEWETCDGAEAAEEAATLLQWGEERTTESPNNSDEPTIPSNCDYPKDLAKPEKIGLEKAAPTDATVYKLKRKENPIYSNLDGDISNHVSPTSLEPSSAYSEIKETTKPQNPELNYPCYANKGYPNSATPLSSSNGATDVNNFPPPDKETRPTPTPRSRNFLEGDSLTIGSPAVRETSVDCPGSPLLDAAHDFEQLRNIEVSCDALLGKVVRLKNSRA